MAAVYAFKPFARYARKAGISDSLLCRAARDIAAGRIDADLGGGVIKQRVAREGEGRSGGFRTIVLFRSGTDLFFIRGFAKNERDNITAVELALFKKASAVTLRLSQTDIAVAIAAGEIIAIDCEGVS
ncbi:type II toxin-antitoxin system RelE/ParE family toxin [Bosea sp. (in: a-proteobacteria)]|uniref:type II toxin-antitoxin system RelE/ParE family toxin n=1 Tax=Bosea sp. (in: a-proteobacteria) TaxID=1871050 RepID=UPI0027365454|nr:type II toxin-antitoxin system RelE/ParE family toxin [Bosea sp. (in: a-proteobacteria)]MDP3410676.1 type II toxin-antitoxin system RelE/ParE family toxin [Bosea sp. (in: a-proteobacteria)]